jgi:RNA polymerase sigma-70 factor (ECF subfamily)
VTSDVFRRQDAQVIADDLLVSLVERASAGDADAWEALYRRAYPGMLGYASRRLGADRGADAVAEAMARAVARIGTFRWHGAGFDAWLYGILRHVVLDAHRARARESRRRVPTDGELAGPLEHVLAGEEARAVRAAFATLDPNDQEILELRVVAGLSAEEVGRVVGRRAGAVRMAQSRALAALRRAMTERES